MKNDLIFSIPETHIESFILESIHRWKGQDSNYDEVPKVYLNTEDYWRVRRELVRSSLFYILHDELKIAGCEIVADDKIEKGIMEINSKGYATKG